MFPKLSFDRFILDYVTVALQFRLIYACDLPTAAFLVGFKVRILWGMESDFPVPKLISRLIRSEDGLKVTVWR